MPAFDHIPTTDPVRFPDTITYAVDGEDVIVQKGENYFLQGEDVRVTAIEKNADEGVLVFFIDKAGRNCFTRVDLFARGVVEARRTIYFNNPDTWPWPMQVVLIGLPITFVAWWVYALAATYF